MEKCNTVSINLFVVYQNDCVIEKKNEVLCIESISVLAGYWKKINQQYPAVQSYRHITRAWLS